MNDISKTNKFLNNLPPNCGDVYALFFRSKPSEQYGTNYASIFDLLFDQMSVQAICSNNPTKICFEI